MAKNLNSIERAHKSLIALKAIVRLERKRSEANPKDQRYIEIGITEAPWSKGACAKEIQSAFNYFEYILDCLHISLMAASFESEAMPRISTAVGESKTLLRDEFASKPWTPNLILETNDINGLKDIFDLLSLPSQLTKNANTVKKIRNDFCHGINVDEIDIGFDEAMTSLVGILNIITP